MHEHDWAERDRHENDFRTRTMDLCRACGAKRYGCCPKQFDDRGEPAWGKTIGQWEYVVRDEL